MSFHLAKFQREIENQSGKKLKLRFNDNRSTMLSVKWLPKSTEVSLHRMFCEAPEDVMQALANYICKEHKCITPSIKAFIEEGIKNLDYSHLIDPKKLSWQGTVYDLKKIYTELNEEYFEGKLNLSITWFGKSVQRNKSQVTFGLYYDPLKLIKVNRLLDSHGVPDYIIAYVVYHEMLHNVCPAYIDEKGVSRIHNKEFKAREAKFRYFTQAQNWIKRYQHALFSDAFSFSPKPLVPSFKRKKIIAFKKVKKWQDTVNGQTSNIARKRQMRKKAKSFPE